VGDSFSKRPVHRARIDVNGKQTRLIQENLLSRIDFLIPATAATAAIAADEGRHIEVHCGN
ncbi:hypothetical protein ACVBEF_16945, partial [Glaciimonas sp. GG7]